jgi:hypothetical protein
VIAVAVGEGEGRFSEGLERNALALA